MPLYCRFKSIAAVLAVLMTCSGDVAGGAVLPTIDNNFTDDGAVVREPSFGSEAALEEQLARVVAPPAMLYYLEMIRNRIRQPADLFTRMGLQSMSRASRPVAALMREMSEGRNNKLSRRRDGYSMDRGIAWIRKRSAGTAMLPGIAYENPVAGAVQTGYFGKGGDVDCDEGLRRLEAGCRRSLKVNHAEEEEEGNLGQKEKRREFVVDLGKRFDEFRVDLGKRFIINDD